MYAILTTAFTVIFLRSYHHNELFWPIFLSLTIGQSVALFNLHNSFIIAIVYAILIAMSFIDHATGEIPHLLTIALLCLGMIFGAINFGTIAFVTFAVLFVCLFVLNFVSNNKGIGAGDLKLYMIFGLFFPLYYYLLFMIINTICDLAYLGIAKRFKWETLKIKYAPILSISFFITALIIGFVF